MTKQEIFIQAEVWDVRWLETFVFYFLTMLTEQTYEAV